MFDRKPETNYLVRSQSAEGGWERGTLTRSSYLPLSLRPGCLSILTGGDSIPQTHVGKAP